jgi:hypothetical protein
MKTTDQMLTDAIKRNQELDEQLKSVKIETLNLKLEIGRLNEDNQKKAKYIKGLERSIELIDKLNNVKI